MMNNAPLVLIIDDEPAILKALKNALTDEQYRVETLSDASKALDIIGKLIPNLILLDIFMPNYNGLDLLQDIKKEYPDQQIIMISGYGNIPIAVEAIKKGAIDFIEKPLNLDEILQKIAALKDRKRHKQPSRTESLVEHGIVGQSNLFLELISQATQIAPHTFPILINGERGVGKTTLAAFIHKKSNVTAHPFLPIDCETTTKTNLQKAFISKINQTIYLKHVDLLPKTLQQDLLELAKNNTTARVIASCTHQLFALCKKNRFNASLFHWLNRAPLEIPPLRKRAYDIPLLLKHYVSHFNAQHKKQAILSLTAIRLLRNYEWPGNIIQLKYTIEKLIITNAAENNVITPDQLRTILGEKNIEIIEEQSLGYFSSLHEATTTFEKNYLLYLLRKNYYNLEQVCNHIQLSQNQLKNKLTELKIEVPQ